MYKKVEFECGNVTIDGEVIGTEGGTMNNGTVVIEKNNGTFIFAEYGTMVDNEFIHSAEVTGVLAVKERKVRTVGTIGKLTRMPDTM